MKKEETLFVYYCDCCEIQLGIKEPYKTIDGCNHNSRGVSYEPKVLGDYCEDCLQLAQENWDNNSTNGFVSDRYDKATEEAIKLESENMKEMRKLKIDDGTYYL